MNLGKTGLIAITLTSAVALSACGGSSSSNPLRGQADQGELRVIHASANAPDVNVNANGSPVSALQGLTFGTGSQRLTLDADSYDVSVDAIVPTGTTQVVAPTTVPVNLDQITNVLAVGNVGDNFGPLVVTADKASVASTDTRVQVVHGATGASTVDVYVTANDADLTDVNVTPLATLDFKDDAGPVTVPAGNYRIRITPAGDDTTVAFDSGEIALPGGSDLLVVAIDNTGSEDSPVRLLVSTGTGGDFVLRDQNAGTDLRVVHAASGVGGADVFARSVEAGINDFTRIVENIAFLATDESNTDLTAADDYQVRVNVNEGGADGPIAVDGISLDGGEFYTAIAAGDLVAETEELILAVDDRRSVATEARVRAIHAASVAGTVDVFVRPTGTVTAAEIEDRTAGTPEIPDFEVGAVTTYISLAEDAYDIFVRAGNSVVISALNQQLDAGDVVTLIAHNPDTDEGVTDPGFVILAD